ncbi:hypothetical protein [Salinispora arenicola]|uniref:hypothetical protein n=1 Tax=Salinispora arenicola TaxID=168697 RepID=UPI0003685264|nr:hypothetical protein [Salinispora arenicola]
MTFGNETALTGYARAAVAIKTRMHDFCTSTAGSEYTRAFVETLFANSPEPEPHGEATPDQKVAEVINRASGTVWAQGEAYVLAPAMTAIVAAAAEALDLTGDLLTADAAPADGGVLFLPEPIYHRNLNGQVSGIAAITWTTVSSPSGRSWLICGWADRDDPEDPHAARIRGYTRQDPTLLSRLGPYVMTNLDMLPIAAPVPAVEHPDDLEPDRDWEAAPDGRYVIADATPPHPRLRGDRLRVLAHPGATHQRRRAGTTGPVRPPPRRTRLHRAQHPRGDAAAHLRPDRTRRRTGQVALPCPVRRARSLAPPDRRARAGVPDLGPGPRQGTRGRAAAARREGRGPRPLAQPALNSASTTARSSPCP